MGLTCPPGRTSTRHSRWRQKADISSKKKARNPRKESKRIRSQKDSRRIANGWQTDSRRMANGWQTDGKRNYLTKNLSFQTICPSAFLLTSILLPAVFNPFAIYLLSLCDPVLPCPFAIRSGFSVPEAKPKTSRWIFRRIFSGMMPIIY